MKEAAVGGAVLRFRRVHVPSSEDKTVHCTLYPPAPSGQLIRVGLVS